MPRYLVNKKEGVYNKAMLRMIRRYYLNLFKQENKKLVRKRFIRVKTYESIKGAKKMVAKYFPKYTSGQLHYFLVRLFGCKYKSMNPPKNTAEERGDFVEDTIDNYTQKKFERLHKIPEFKIIFRHIFEDKMKGEESKKVYEYILENEGQKVSNNLDCY